MAKEVKNEEQEIDFDSIKGEMKVTFLKTHPKFAHVEGQTATLRKSAIEKFELLEKKYVHEAK